MEKIYDYKYKLVHTNSKNKTVVDRVVTLTSATHTESVKMMNVLLDSATHKTTNVLIYSNNPVYQMNRDYDENLNETTDNPTWAFVEAVPVHH